MKWLKGLKWRLWDKWYWDVYFDADNSMERIRLALEQETGYFWIYDKDRTYLHKIGKKP